MLITNEDFNGLLDAINVCESETYGFPGKDGSPERLKAVKDFYDNMSHLKDVVEELRKKFGSDPAG